jgi:mRNA interferase RelE/StbE
VWSLEFTKKSQKSLDKIDKKQATRIVDFLDYKLAQHDNPRDLGAALSGDLAGHWRYRVGDYRIICKIEDETITILVIEIGLRREIYR